MNSARRRAGWWGIAFVVVLLVAAAMVSLPTGKVSGQAIRSFYGAHAPIIVLQQLLGASSLVPLVAFAVALGARRRPLLLAGTILVVITELATNVVPLLIVLSNPPAGVAHTLTVIDDLADSALFLALGVLAVAATSHQPGWLRYGGLLVAAVLICRALLSPLGVDALDQLAPIAFIALILVLATRQLLGKARAG